jgi:hypothetical protein
VECCCVCEEAECVSDSLEKHSSVSSCANLTCNTKRAQNGHKTGTLTFKSEEAKAEILGEECPEGWIVDDKFDGLTVLFAPERPEDADIEFVHFPLSTVRS